MISSPGVPHQLETVSGPPTLVSSVAAEAPYYSIGNALNATGTSCETKRCLD